MTLIEIRTQVLAEAKIQDPERYGPLCDLFLHQYMDMMTSQVKYPELLIPDHSIVLTAATQTVTLPADLQHIDINNIRYLTGGDASVYRHLSNFHRFWGSNLGVTRFALRAGSTLKLWPYSEISGTDTIVFNYWKKSAFSADNDTVLPDQLVPTLITKTIARIANYTSADIAILMKGEAKELFAQSFGVTDVNAT